LASDNTKLLDALNTAMMHDRADQLRQSITTALNTWTLGLNGSRENSDLPGGYVAMVFGQH